MNRVILAANDHPDYQFLLPLTCILWAERTHWRPSVIVPRQTKAIGFLKQAGMIDVYQDHSIPSDRLAIKLTRWYSHNYWPDDNLLLQDVDLFPVSTNFWNRGYSKPVVCRYGDAFNGKRHCTSGFSAPAEVLAQIAGGTWEERLEWLRKHCAQGDERLHSDDAAQSPLVIHWMGTHTGDYEIMKRGPETPPKDRIDRSDWPKFKSYSFSAQGASTIDDRPEQEYVDAHLPRDASDRRVWNMIYPLFQILAPGWEHWAKAYYEAWSRA